MKVCELLEVTQSLPLCCFVAWWRKAGAEALEVAQVGDSTGKLLRLQA